MATNHLKTANKYIEKQISKLLIEQQKLHNKAQELLSQSDVIAKQIEGLEESRKKLMPENLPY